MDEAGVVAALEAAERALDSGGSLKGTGFWPAVAQVKRSPQLVDRYADRIAAIDRRAFEPWPMLNIPIRTGTVLATLAAVIGLGAVAAAYYLDEPWNWLVFGAGTVALLASTHTLAHLVVGTAMGIRFTSWFVGSPTRPQPGIKLDYASYLRTPARKRAWMHASGAIATKLVPILLIPASIAAGLPAWVTWILAVFTAVAIVTDVAWSTKSSDWMKFRREIRFR